MNCPKCGAVPQPFLSSCAVCGNTALLNASNHSGELNLLANPLLITLDSFLLLFKSPQRFFERELPRLPIWTALVFALFFGSISLLATYAWSVSLPQLGLQSEIGSEMSSMGPTNLLFSPFIILMQLLLFAGVLHLLLSIFRVRKNEFSQTLKLVCYCEGAMILYLIPYLGPLLGFGFGLYWIIVGISAIHETTKTKAAMVILSPLFLITFLLVVAIFAAGSLTAIIGQLISN